MDSFVLPYPNIIIPVVIAIGVILQVYFQVIPKLKKKFGTMNSAKDVLNAVNVQNPDNVRIIKDGIHAKATVISVENTDQMLNAEPLCIVKVKVNNAGYEYEASAKTVIPHLQLANMQPGNSVNVKIDPMNPTKIVITAP